MTPEQKIKQLILIKTAEWNGVEPPLFRSDNIDELYDDLVNEDAHWDGESEVRCSGIKTDLPCPSSRHYECESVAAQMPDGSWVGWNYWYGGGKHGEPGSMDWMGKAYNINCEEKEQMTIIRKFSIAE